MVANRTGTALTGAVRNGLNCIGDTPPVTAPHYNIDTRIGGWTFRADDVMFEYGCYASGRRI